MSRLANYEQRVGIVTRRVASLRGLHNHLYVHVQWNPSNPDPYDDTSINRTLLALTPEIKTPP